MWLWWRGFDPLCGWVRYVNYGGWQVENGEFTEEIWCFCWVGAGLSRWGAAGWLVNGGVNGWFLWVSERGKSGCGYGFRCSWDG